MSFGGLILTSSGRNLLAKAQAGKELKFTRVGLGDGTLGTGSIADLQTLRNEVKSLNITNLEVVEGNAEVTTFLANTNMTEGFYLREIGIFALDPDLGEILYCYDNSGKDADYIPPKGEVIIERNMRFTLIVGNASSVTATINSSLVFATKKDLEDLKDSVSKEIESIEVPVKSVNSKTGAVTLAASDVGAVPVGRKVNNKPLSADISLTPADVGASPAGHVHAYGTLTGIPGTFPPSPHTHPPAQVGLGSVLNYGIATTAEAQAGASNAKYMTPFLVNVAVKHLATTGGISMVKGVQRGIYEGSLEADKEAIIPISSVIVNKASVNLLTIVSMAETGYHDHYIHLRLINATTIGVKDRGRDGYGKSISWEVIEYY